MYATIVVRAKKCKYRNVHMQKRPVLDLPLTKTEATLLVLTIIGVLLCFFPLFIYWQQLPATVPTHFDVAGHVNAYGSKYTLLLLPVIAVIITAGIAVLAKFPQIYNYPVKITPENAERNYRFARMFLRWLNFLMVCFFAFLQWKTVQVAIGNASDLGSWSMPFTIKLAILIPISALVLIVVWSIKGR